MSVESGEIDVERLVRALFGVLGWPHRLQPLYMDGDFDNPLWAKWATDIAREYAALWPKKDPSHKEDPTMPELVKRAMDGDR